MLNRLKIFSDRESLQLFASVLFVVPDKRHKRYPNSVGIKYFPDEKIAG